MSVLETSTPNISPPTPEKIRSMANILAGVMPRTARVDLVYPLKLGVAREIADVLIWSQMWAAMYAEESTVGEVAK